MNAGTVITFDEHRGYGTIRATDGRALFFHCTRIADGTRTIEVGAEVVFDVLPGHGGRWEAAAISRPAAASAPR